MKVKKITTQKGITLIALIITIVLLLILAVVAIRAVQGEGIIYYAKNAQIEYEKAQAEEEERLLELEYQIASAQKTFTGTYDEYVLEKTYGLKIGDYVDYKYDTVSTDYLLLSTYSGYIGPDQTIPQVTNLKWRVLGLDQNGNIELISATPAESKYAMLEKVAGYNNGVYLLNDMCKELYSNKEYGIYARNLTIEDIEKQLSDEGKKVRAIQGYGKTNSYDANNKYPVLYAEEKGSGTNGLIREDGIGQSESFYTKKEDLTTSYTSAKDSNGKNTSLNVTNTSYQFGSGTGVTPSSYFRNETFHNMIFETETVYWLASRAVDCLDKFAGFNIYVVAKKQLFHSGMFRSYGPDDGTSWYHYGYLRPVVSLGSGVSVDTSSGDGTEDSMYTIVKK